MKLGEFIKKYRDDNKMSMDAFADRVGLSKSYISILERDYNPSTGKAVSPTIQVIKRISEATKVDFDDLINMLDDDYEITVNDAQDSFTPLTMNIPLYQQLSCGKGLFVEDNIEEYITLPESLLKPNKEYFCQYASGDSMIDENIKPGDLLVFEKTQTIENGQVGCFCIDDNVATCKKFYKDDASAIITLQPANSKYAPIIVTVETMNFHIIGKLSLVINKRD